MGYASSGNTSQSNGLCTFQGDAGDEYYYYQTSEDSPSGVNGAQGRLYLPPGESDYYFDINVTADDTEWAALDAWFESAASIGTGGSNIEMLTAPVGWVADPANSATNDGFIRDAATVMVVFFMQDEPDQTPLVLDDINGGQAMLNRLVAAKTMCGGLDCIVSAGYADAEACYEEPRPIKYFLDGLTIPYIVEPIPDDDTPAQDLADEMADMLINSMLPVVADTCEAIVT